MDKKFPKYIVSEFAICNLAVAPIRAFPDDRSEMISQLLFGELCEILDYKNKSWVKIKCTFDGYVGWIDPKQIQYVEENVFQKYQGYHPCSTDIALPLMNQNLSFPILLGSTLPFYDGISLKMPNAHYTFSGSTIDIDSIPINEELIMKLSKRFLNAPYLWGGRSPFGIDCSGLVQQVYKILGVPMKRDASLQVEGGELVPFPQAARVGDLAFFDNAEGIIHHVGIILDDQKIIHASGKVRIDTLDQNGIIHSDTGKYTHKLRIIKRVLKYEESKGQITLQSERK
ncbi:MAG TPA: C40 family peptidase [Saprospiraceae bacterium]|nr:C40 family peptidase [Saprospiraceae bacterium]